ncbi:hypothetical protein S7711_00208 [Stachybotrys chartarum IBT 7711]|uniref:mitogen-activated protein kinase kinase n=1 Tax=Stachybotrys chartarum (strain CBS 109288 / IBT 7711) TaxID=1280523 RepID=A0A084B3S8_STACB|nr:hypothetical protein S7711_00208 [Stachybotrys chartarum IBT 7711]KFA52126.1 hypothetical protein S40293_00604 [Stachybotrys chartarum IBT 40293]
MSSICHVPPALFSLEPIGASSMQAVVHQGNEHLISYLRDGSPIINVGHVRSASDVDLGDTLATLGRDGDVVVQGDAIASVQCAFAIDPETHLVMFHDRSHNMSSRVLGIKAVPFEANRPRKAVVRQGCNELISMGGEGGEILLFRLTWFLTPEESRQMTANRPWTVLQLHPLLAKTMKESARIFPPRTIAARASKPPLMTYHIEREIGFGRFSTVYRALDLDTWKPVAVKILTRPDSGLLLDWHRLKRDVESLCRNYHPHVVEYITSQRWDANAEIFTGLKDGSLESLMDTRSFDPVDLSRLGHIVVQHTLEALDFLACHNIMHGNVKPSNILYQFQEGQYVFQLGDFAQSDQYMAPAICDRRVFFKAPEVYQLEKYTPRADVWSLYVTVLWTFDVRCFRTLPKLFREYGDVLQLVLSLPWELQAISEMARLDVETRPSAAQMLVKCFGGSGLTTPRHLVPPLACTNTEIQPTFDVPPSPRPKTPPPRLESLLNYRRTPRSRLSGGGRVGKFKRMNRYRWPGMLGRLGVAVVDERRDIPAQGVLFGLPPSYQHKAAQGR